MSEFARSAPQQLLVALLFGAGIAITPAPAPAQVAVKENAGPPDFSAGHAGWVTIGTDWIALPGRARPRFGQG